MTFDPMTIEHLGVRMYSTLPPVLSELIANSYDANASGVTVTLNDTKDGKEIAVEDDGIGMSFDDLNEKFLKIGRNRREADGTDEVGRHRKVIGKKGLGKLSFFGVANEIEVMTRKDGKENAFLMKWEDIEKSDKDYEPTPLRVEADCDPEFHGTAISLRGIKRESDFAPDSLATSLSRIFITDPNFVISIRHNGEEPVLVSNERKYEKLDKQVEWNVPEDIGREKDYLQEKGITGHLIATTKPIPPNTNMRGVTLFSRKKLVNLPEYFSDSTSSHFFSYLTGWIEVDFIDDLPEDVIATNRQALNWEHPDMAVLREKLRSVLDWMQVDWRDKRAAIRNKALTDKSGIRVREWLDTMTEDIRSEVTPILTELLKDSELPDEATGMVVKKIHQIVPEYPKYHWRYLHAEIKSISEEDYKKGNYFDAAEKACRLYVQRVKERAAVDTGKDDNDMDQAFNPGAGKLMVTDCLDTTKKNIQAGQHLLSKGMIAGFRNPLTHNPEYQKKLIDTGLFSEKDCLDVLSLLSHLFGRLDRAIDRPSP